MDIRYNAYKIYKLPCNVIDKFRIMWYYNKNIILQGV